MYMLFDQYYRIHRSRLSFSILSRSGIKSAVCSRWRVGRVVAQQALTFENLPKNRLRRFIDIDNIHWITELGTDSFHQLHFKMIAYRRTSHDCQIDIAAKVFLPFRIYLRTEQYRQSDIGIV